MKPVMLDFDLRSPARAARALLLLLAASALAFVRPAAAADPPDPALGAAPDVAAVRLYELKRMQRELLMRGAHAKMTRARAARWKPPDYRPRRPRRKAPKEDAFTLAGLRARRATGREAQATPPGYGTPESAGIPAGPRLLTDPNVFANDPNVDVGNEGQSEPSIASWGRYVVAAWNDGAGFNAGGSIQGFSTSTDSGATFVDMGVPPAPGGGIWASDPVVSVNEKTGEFYFCALADVGLTSTVSVVRGTFSGNTFTWDTPHIAGQKSVFNGFLDKCWMVADSSSGNVYVTYTDFVSLPEGNGIVFQRSVDGGTTWSSPVQLSPGSASRLVQGSRPAVGPDGRLYVVWKEIGPTDVDFFRIRISTDGGLNFQSQGTIASHYDNFGSGAPGFNRERGITYPAIAVDRSFGPNRGRVYVAWNESTNWYDSVSGLGTSGTVSEVEPNDTIAGAVGFTPGNELAGSAPAGDVDVFAFAATRGLTYVFYCDDPPSTPYRTRIVCADRTTRLATAGDADVGGNPSVLVWTAPTTDTYYFGMINLGNNGGTYTIQTGIDPSGPERGRDARDIIVASSANGTSWSVPVRVNDDPPYFDNWLPEVAVDAFGTVWTSWFDWRDALAMCGGASHVYLARSENAGTSWNSLGPASDVQTDWTAVSSNIIPNQGDYVGLFANDRTVIPVWTDGRRGNPDIVAAPLRLYQTQISVQGVVVDTNHVQVTWRATKLGLPASVTVGVYRRFGAAAWDSVATISSNASGTLVYDDTDITAGVGYQYRLRLAEGGVSRFVGYTAAFAPLPIAPDVSLGSPYPNPTPRNILVPLTLTGTDPATLKLFDVTGREVRSLQIGWLGAGNHVVNLAEGAALRPGLYVVKFEQGGLSLTRRVTVVP